MGMLRDILATRHGIDITEQQEQILFDDLHAIMKINKTMTSRAFSPRKTVWCCIWKTVCSVCRT